MYQSVVTIGDTGAMFGLPVMTKHSDVKSILDRAGHKLSVIDQVAAYLYQNHYPLEPALEAYKKYLARQPEFANAVFNYAYYLAKDGQFESAIKMYRRSIELEVSSPEEAFLNIANIFTDHLRNNEQARQYLLKAVARNPGYAGAYYNLGNLAEQDGDRSEAARYFEHCLEIDPSNATALARLADTHKFVEPDDPLLARLMTYANDTGNSDVEFALGKAYEQLGDFQLAWRYFSRGNERDRQAFPVYRQEKSEAHFKSIMTACSRQWQSQHQGESHAFVFICGMFRTGSTLLEQILAAHPSFGAGGESEFFPRLVHKYFPAYPEGLHSVEAEKLHEWKQRHLEYASKLGTASTRLVDKRPDNFLYAGLIKAILPAAKIVVTERDWRDVATSIYSTRLGPSQNYATTLQGIRHYIGLQEQLVDHWQSILGDDLIRIRYEDLVSEPRQTVSVLLEALGEDWDERCLSFYKLDNSVQTASVWQVREPFHKRSIGRWKNYKGFFEDALDGTPGF